MICVFLLPLALSAQIGELIYTEDNELYETNRYDSSLITINVVLKDKVLTWHCLSLSTGNSYTIDCKILKYKEFVDPVDSLLYHSFFIKREGNVTATYIIQLENNSYTLIPTEPYVINHYKYVVGGRGVAIALNLN